MNEIKKFDWPGWSLDENIHGEEFDLPARKRMIDGGRTLLPLLKRNKDSIKKNILEIGPFFHPLSDLIGIQNINVFFWENDPNVLSYLEKKYKNKPVFPIKYDLNKIKRDTLHESKLEAQKYFQKSIQKKVIFDAVILSQVLNYVDYKLLLLVLKQFVKKDGLIFINNVVDYGLPNFFSEMRPNCIPSTIRNIEESGYSITEQEIFESTNKKFQKNKRLILVAKNII